MRRIRLCITISLLSLYLSAQTTTWSEQVRENTSACSGTSGTEAHCYSSFQDLWGQVGMSDASPYYVPLTAYYNPVPTNVSGPGSTDQNLHLGNIQRQLHAVELGDIWTGRGD